MLGKFTANIYNISIKPETRTEKDLDIFQLRECYFSENMLQGFYQLSKQQSLSFV